MASKGASRKKESEMFPIHDFSVIDEAFPATVLPYMPKREDIPEEFRFMRSENKFSRFFGDMFFFGVTNLKMKPRDGVDREKAWRHLRCIAGSFEPQHEHKEEAFAYLMSQWFEDVEWERAAPTGGHDE